MNSSFPHYIDNTMRKTLVKCQKAAHYSHELGLRHMEEKRVDLHAGAAFAKGIETARRAYYFWNNPIIKATQTGIADLFEAYGDFQCPKGSDKTAERMAGALQYYLEKYPLNEEKYVPLNDIGIIGLEMCFELPIEGIRHPDNGKQIYYCGKFDMLAIEAGTKNIWVVDEKTTSQMGDKWANQWPLDAQMTGYCWAAQKLLLGYPAYADYEIIGAIINGIAIRKYDYEVGRFSTYREPWQIQRWWNQLRGDLQDWIAAYKAGSHRFNLDHSCAYYLNPCQFMPLCTSKNPERLYPGAQYKVEFWNPSEKEQR